MNFINNKLTKKVERICFTWSTVLRLRLLRSGIWPNVRRGVGMTRRSKLRNWGN